MENLKFKIYARSLLLAHAQYALKSQSMHFIKKI
jgi:hypothetical protein